MRATSAADAGLAAKRDRARGAEASSAPIRLRPFRTQDLDALVAFWNQAFATRRNFLPMTPDLYRRRVLDCPAFDPGGLILAWQEVASADAAQQSTGHKDRPEALVGLVHAMKPAPQVGIYARWGPHHSIAVLYVQPDCRGQGVGARLLQAAENWLYFCPVVMAGHSQPAYGSIEGPRPAFFGSTERMGIEAHETELLHFLARHGYGIDEPGDVSMTLATHGARYPRPAPFDLSAHGLTLRTVSNTQPFTGREPPGREEYRLWGDNQGDPYHGYLLVNRHNMLRGHLSWYPLPEPGRVALGAFWLAPELRSRGLGAYLLDLSLHVMSETATQAIELHTHLTLYARAVDLYESRGFKIDAAWVNLVKT